MSREDNGNPMINASEIATACLDALRPKLGKQHIVARHDDRGRGPFAFEFCWTDGKCYKVVVSDAEDVGVENMVYPPL